MSETVEDIRKRILEAAMVRFERFGYGKTSMAEIADDCEMSPGNLYRYFRNKLDIAETLMHNVNEQLCETLSAEAKQGDTAAEKLENIIVAKLHKTWEISCRFPSLREPTHRLTSQRPMLWQQLMSNLLAVVEDVLKHGNKTGEFNVADTDKAAKLVMAATFKYFFPEQGGPFVLEDLEEEARGVVKMLILGLDGR